MFLDLWAARPDPAAAALADRDVLDQYGTLNFGQLGEQGRERWYRLAVAYTGLPAMAAALAGGRAWVDSRRNPDGTWQHTPVYTDTGDHLADTERGAP